MTYDQMQSMVELYLLEAERDGIEPCGIPVGEARELLLDFAQWFCDDVQDELKADLTVEDITMQGDGTMIFAMGSPEWADAYTHRLKADTSWGILNASNEEESQDE